MAISLFAVMAMDAQNIIRPKVECPNGIYVNSYNGVLFYQRPDVSVVNRNMKLEAVFYYNSSSNEKNYGYGNGWSLGSELRYINDSLGIIIEQGDGRQDLYTRYGNTFVAPAGVFSTLSIDGDGYLLTYKDGTKYYFADTVSKKVTQVKDRYNNAITYSYQNGNLATASDISGRSLHFSWSNGLLSGISTSFDDRTWSYQYNENGNLTSVTDPMGYTVHYSYNQDNRIKTFTDAEGYSTHISYNSDGMAHRVKTDLTDKSIRYEIAKHQTVFVDYLKDANNQYSKYVWDEQGRLVEIVNVNMGTSTKFAYDDDNNMVRREDANGNAYLFTYDQNGNRLSATDPLGYTEYYTYESTYNKVTSYTDKMGHYYNYQYNNKGDLLQMNGPLNYTVTMTYNQYGQIQTVTDAAGHSYSFVYDNFGNMVSLTDPLGNVTTNTYSESGWSISTTMPNGGVTYCNYDDNGNIISVLDALNHELSSSYDRRGNLVSMTDARMNSVNIIYDALNQIVQVTDQQGGQKNYTYDAKGNIINTVDAMGQSHRIFYNADNFMSYAVGPLNDTVQCHYDNVGNVVGFRAPNGRVVTTQYDALNRIIQRSDQLGIMYSYTYDPNGNILSYTDADGNTSYYEYDALGRVVTFTDALGHSEYYSYDVLGNMLTRQDRNGNATLYSYDAMNRILTETDAMGFVTNYGYDAMGNLTTVIYANGKTNSFEYNLKGKRTKVTYADGSTERYWYDENDNLSIKEDDLGRYIFYAYNTVNQLIRVDYPNQASDEYTYNLNGEMLTATNENAVVAYTYDELGRILSESINGTVTSYNYDTDYQYITMTYPSGKTLKQEMDLRNRVQNVRDMNSFSVIASFAYNGMDKVIQKTYANGITTDFVYNACGNLIEQYDNADQTHFSLGYDANGNLITKKDFVNESQSETYVYNLNNQLTNYYSGVMDNNNSIPSPANTWLFELNPLGEIISETVNGVLSQYFSDNSGTLVTLVDGEELTSHYNDHGLLVSDNNHTYQYDYRDRLVGVDFGNTASYLYDALGRRIQRTVATNSGSQTEQYLYSGTSLIECDNPSGQTVYSNYYGFNGQLLQKDSGNQQYYYHTDQNFSITSITNNLGTAVEHYSYNPNGQTSVFDASWNLLQPSAALNSFCFMSCNRDLETGFYDGSVHSTDTHFTLNPLTGFSTNLSIDSKITTARNFYDDISNPLQIIGAGNNLLVKITEGMIKRWPHNDLQYRLINNIPISDTYDDYLRLIRTKEGFTQFGEALEKLDKIGKVVDKALKFYDVTKAVLNVGEMIDNVRNANSHKDRMHYFGTWIEDVYNDFCPPVALADWGYKKIYKWVTGEEAEKGLVTLAFEGYGALADFIGQELDYGCYQFERSGYDNATIFQQTMADIVNHPLNIFGNAAKLGYRLGQKWFPVR